MALRIAIALLMAGILTMPLLSRGDGFITATIAVLMLGAVSMGVHLASKAAQDGASSRATFVLYRSAPVFFPLALLGVYRLWH
ncbi:hypothetical protein AB4Y64_08380 [Lysobacter sp. TAF61]|uniref:hypothetical protein n=1 Tax=Lysobacter sp. TAF61 TaxID=3233072 RepID=UPI003F9572B3